MVLVPPEHRLRRQVETCVREVYQRAFGARDPVLPPLLVAWLGRGDVPLCTAGLRTARDGFFLERYLDLPVERVLAAHAAGPVDRARVCELTTLTSRRADASLPFLRSLAALGRSLGFEWAVFTATRRLRALLGRLGVPLIVLAAATPERSGGPAGWGSYYRDAPAVCAVEGRAVRFVEGPLRRRWRHA